MQLPTARELALAANTPAGDSALPQPETSLFFHYGPVWTVAEAPPGTASLAAPVFASGFLLGAALLLTMHFVDIYWFVMPNFLQGKDGFSFHWMDLTCLMAVVGIYGAFVFHRMTKFPLVPIGDPRLRRSLEFQNA